MLEHGFHLHITKMYGIGIFSLAVELLAVILDAIVFFASPLNKKIGAGLTLYPPGSK